MKANMHEISKSDGKVFFKINFKPWHISNIDYDVYIGSHICLEFFKIECCTLETDEK